MKRVLTCKSAVIVLAIIIVIMLGNLPFQASAEEPKPEPPKETKNPVTETPPAPVASPTETKPITPTITLDPAAILEQQVSALIDSLTSNDPLITLEARQELLEIGRPAVPFLLKSLINAKADLKYLITELLSDLRDERATPSMIKLLADRDEHTASIASVAARALGRLGNTAVIPNLMRVITNTDVELRYEAIRALGLLRAKEAIPFINASLSDTAQTSLGYFIKAAAIQALGRLKDTSSAKDIITLLKNTETEPATDEPVLRYVIKALECITDFKTGNISPQADPKKKEEIIKKWEDWWEKNKQNYQ